MDGNIWVAAEMPVCAHYERGINSERVIAVWNYVAGLIGDDGKSTRLGRKISHLYDYKGLLVVAMHVPLTAIEKDMFQRAWKDVGREFRDQVEYTAFGSPRWKTLWAARRF